MAVNTQKIGEAVCQGELGIVHAEACGAIVALVFSSDDQAQTDDFELQFVKLAQRTGGYALVPINSFDGKTLASVTIAGEKCTSWIAEQRGRTISSSHVIRTEADSELS